MNVEHADKILRAEDRPVDTLPPVSGEQNTVASSGVHEAIRLAETALQYGDAVEAVHHYSVALANPSVSSGMRRWLYAHRGDAWARIGGWDEAAKDFEQATAKDKLSARKYAWAWAHWGEMLRLKARDHEETRQDAAEFLATVVKAIANFDTAIRAFADEERARVKNPPTESSKVSAPVYTWAYAHRAAIGVLCWLYYCEGVDADHAHANEPNEHRIPDEVRNAFLNTSAQGSDGDFARRVDEDFESARMTGMDDPWTEQFVALWFLLTSAGKPGRLEAAKAHAGKALLAGASSFPLEAGMVLVALFAYGDSPADCADRWSTTSLRRANHLLLKDPTHPTGHAALAAMYRNYTDEEQEIDKLARERAYHNSLEVLKMNRELLDELIKAVSPEGELRETAEKRRSRGYETSFIARRLYSVVSKRARSAKASSGNG